MSWTEILFGPLGLIALLMGADLLVRGASALAGRAGISPLIIGLTVVAFGTSAPELAVSVSATLDGAGGIALGNVVGSNIANVLLILGLSAAITPLTVHLKLLKFEIPLVFGVSVTVLLVSLDGRVSALEGALLLAGLLAWVGFTARAARRESKAVKAEFRQEFGGRPSPRRGGPALEIGQVLLGLLLLALGGDWLVGSALAAARTLGVSELVAGITIVGVGTSLPEAATSIVAVRRGERDIAVGNVVGSNLFNLLGVLGAAAITAKGGIEVPDSALARDLPVMIGAALICIPFGLSGAVLSRAEGLTLLAYFVAYTTYVVLDSTGHTAAEPLGHAVLRVALPATVLVIVLGAILRRRRRTHDGGRTPRG